MTNNTNIEKLYVKYFSGSATEEEIRTIYTHLEGSEEDRTVFEQLRNLWETTHPAFNPDGIDVEKATRKVIAIVREKNNRRQNAYQKFFSHWSGVAAAILIPLLVVSFFIYRNVNNENMLTGVVLEEQISPAGKVTAMILADGTKVTLNAGSKLIYPKTFKGKQRKVTLEGEGYFEVVKNTSKPFIVHTHRMNIQVLGTKFNVSAYTDLSEVKTTLEEGRVKVTVPNMEQQDMDDSFFLMPNEEISVNTTTGDITKRYVAAVESRRWLQGSLVFNSTPLTDALKQIARKYDVEIEYGAANIAHKRLTVRFEEGESLDKVLDGLKIMIPGISVEEQDNTRFIVKMK